MPNILLGVCHLAPSEISIILNLTRVSTSLTASPLSRRADLTEPVPLSLKNSIIHPTLMFSECFRGLLEQEGQTWYKVKRPSGMTSSHWVSPPTKLKLQIRVRGSRERNCSGSSSLTTNA